MSEKQGKALYAISRQMNFGLNETIMRLYGKPEADLTSKEASDLIDGLNKGTINPHTPTAGAEMVAEKFGAVVQDAEDIPGYNGEPF